MLLRLLYGEEALAQIVVDVRAQLIQLVQVRQEAVADLFADQLRQLGVAQAQPAALRDAVGLVLETVGIS